MPIIEGNAQGIGDTLYGSREDDLMRGYSGNDVMIGGRGNDTVIGGQGEDVMMGGLDSDTFVFSAGHIVDDGTDIITDFDIRQDDMLQFLDSASAQLNILSIQLVYSEIEEQNGFDLRNNVEYGADLVFTIENSATGDTQQVLLLDAWSGGLDQAWSDYLGNMGLAIDGWTTDDALYYNFA